MRLDEWSQVAGIAAIPLGIVVWLVDRKQVIALCKKWSAVIVASFAIVILYAILQRGWFNWLAHPVTWPVWALILIAISGLAVVAMLFYFFGKVSGTQPVPELLNLDPLNYRADEIFGVEWVWSYVYGKSNVNDLSAFCPKKSCMCRLTMQEHPERMAMRQSGYVAGVYIPVSFTCTTCGFTRQFDSDWKKLKNDVFLEIERRIRTGEFQQRMTQSKV